MPAHDHSGAANDAIADTIHEMRPSVTQSWMTLKPTLSPLNLGAGAEWMDFLGRIFLKFGDAIAPCQCPSVDAFDGYSTKTLITLQEDMLEGVTCA
jgi:hypothetical protein